MEPAGAGPSAGVVRVSASALSTARDHALRAYPMECSGALLGPDHASAGNDDRRSVYAAVPAGAAGRDRYLIDPDAMKALAAEAEARGLQVVGFYHSHPQGGPTPSRLDEEAAWPWYVYLIQPVPGGKPAAAAAWVLDDGRRFRQWRIEAVKG